MSPAALLLLLAASALAYRGPRAGTRDTAELERPQLAAISMEKYANDCWKKRPVRRLALAAEASVKAPGAGMEPENIVPFQTVLKDGFMKITCVKDYLLSFGDKFGDGKYSYKLGDVSNVSIVHYTSIVPKEDRQAMDYEVCFEFCRTVPDMQTFGIHNGRDCYCAPFFKAMESDSTQCDAVCEGNPTQMCGGKFKSTVFSMHMCDDSAAELEAAKDRGLELLTELGSLVGHAQNLSASMQTAAEDFQAIFGQLGDPAASDLMQSAKVYAGEIEHAAEREDKIAGALTNATTKAQNLAGVSLTNATAANEAEGLTKELQKLTAAALDGVEELTALTRDASPTLNASAGAALQYYPVMYFVDKTYQDVPTTCTGAPAAKPMTSVSRDECAQACDDRIHTCVGFTYYSPPPALCFLISKFTEATYYTGCNSTVFLQRGELARNASSPPVTTCMAKLSKFQGKTLAPDGGGKCAECLKEAVSSNRCPVVP